MSPRERYEAQLAGERVDHHARLPILMQFAAEYIGSNYREFASDHRVLVEANLRCAEDFGFEQLSCISDPYRETAGFGAEIHFPDNRGPECPLPPLADSDDLNQLIPPDPEQAPRMRDRIDAVRLFRQRAGEAYSVMGWVEGPAALAADLRGVSNFMMDLLDEPEWCEALMDICVETAIAFALCQIEAGADTIGVGDAICSQLSASTHAVSILPRQRKLLAAIRNAGAHTRLHICGQTKHLWPSLIDLPISILDVDHMVDLRLAVDEFPTAVCFAGNLDPVSVMRFGDPPMIANAVRACQTIAGRRLMVGAGCEIPSGTPNENLKALCQPLPMS